MSGDAGIAARSHPYGLADHESPVLSELVDAARSPRIRSLTTRNKLVIMTDIRYYV
jgi:hypothetical protein